MKKGIPVAWLLLLVGWAKGDPLDDAKTVFGQFVQYQENRDLKFLDLFSPDCEVEIIEADDSLTVVTPITLDFFKTSIKGSFAKEAKTTDRYQDLRFTATEKGVEAAGTVRIGNDDAARPFFLSFASDPGGALKISSFKCHYKLNREHIRCHGLFEFDMPGAWKTKDLDEQKPAKDVLICSGSGSGNGQIIFTAIEDRSANAKDRTLESIPRGLAEPILQKIEKDGGKITRRSYTLLDQESKDRGYFEFSGEVPKSGVLHITGVSIQTAKRKYIIQYIGPTLPQKEMWRAVADSLKEIEP